MLDRTSRAPRRDRLADGLTEGHQQTVVFDPIAARQRGSQRRFTLLGGPRPDKAPSVGYPMDVDIDADSGLAVGLGDDQVGSFAPDPFEGHQRLDGVRYAPVETLQQLAAYPDDNRGLGAVEADRIDQSLDRALAQRQHCLRRIGAGEQPRRGL